MPQSFPTIDLTMLMGVSLPSPFQVDKCGYSAEPIMQQDFGRIGTMVKIEGEGFFSCADQPSLKSAIDAITNAGQINGVDFNVMGPSGAIEFKLAAASCIEGGPNIGFKVLGEGSGPYYRRLSFTVTGRTASTVLLNSFKLEIATGADGLERVTQTGIIVGVATDSYFQQIILPPFKSNYPASNWVVSYKVEYPSGGTLSWSNLQTRYSLSAVGMATPLPVVNGATIVEGEVTSRQDRDDQQRIVVVTQYDLILSSGDYSAIVTALRPDPGDNQIIHESANYISVRQRRLNLSFSCLSSASNDNLLNYSRTAAITTSDDAYTEFTYPGADPIAVKKPAALARVSDSGSMTGLGMFLQAPDPLLEDYEERPQLRLVAVNDYEMQTNWSRSMIQTDGTDIDVVSIVQQMGRPMNPSAISDDGGGG